jgi:hypothetical protein
MPYKDIVKELKKLDQGQRVELTLDPGKKGLVEECQTSAEYEGYWVSFLASTNWRSSEIKTTEMDLEDVVKLLKKKTLDKMTDRDFYGISNENSSDGGMDFSDVEWQEGTPEEIQEEADLYDLYFKGEIDCDCRFDGLVGLDIYVDGDIYTIRDSYE